MMARSRVCYTLVVDLAVSGCGTPLPTQREASSQSTERNRTVANIKSQKKRIKQAEKARVRNQAVRSELKTYVKKVREAVAAGDAEAAQTAAYAANRKLDKAASKGVIHKNQAAQRKSGVQKLVNTLQK
jgi:small subunit ribosomal protein S20